MIKDCGSEELELLLGTGSDINYNNYYFSLTPLHYAAKCNSKKSMEFLLSRGADTLAVAEDGCTPLAYAAFFKSRECVSLLLGHTTPPDLNLQDKEGDTPLHSAAYRNCHHILALLLAHTPAPNLYLKNKQNKTPFEVALAEGSDECAALLANSGGKDQVLSITRFFFLINYFYKHIKKCHFPPTISMRKEFVIIRYYFGIR